ncbi:ABC transporter permease [Alicyclobacillus curvatus]|jgi:ABC-type transport system involved in multi-copper enzyme maturation permease subunit|nr:ABC transporter permease [Alicyclobacillus curvatus]
MMTIAVMTWIEILRKRVLIVTIALTLLFLGLFTYAVHSMASGLATFAAGAGMGLMNNFLHGALFLAIGMYAASFTVAYLAIFSAAGTISTEIENGLLLAILPRPLARWRVYVGKFIGYAFWGLLYGAVMYWSVVVIVKMNLPFPASVTSLLRGFAVFEGIPLILVTLSMLASLYLPTLGAGISVSLLFGVGLIGGVLQRMNFGTGPATSLDQVGLITSLMVPSNALYYRMVYELMGGSNSPVNLTQLNGQLGPFGGGAAPSNAFLVYAAVYICVLVVFSAYHFTRKDI